MARLLLALRFMILKARVEAMECGDCGKQWFPRSRIVNPQCPRCKRLNIKQVEVLAWHCTACSWNWMPKKDETREMRCPRRKCRKYADYSGPPI
jgi:predicted RNA-binding Zn-ribbon protein involved in translation (DUF1610 family)